MGSSETNVCEIPSQSPFMRYIYIVDQGLFILNAKLSALEPKVSEKNVSNCRTVPQKQTKRKMCSFEFWTHCISTKFTTCLYRCIILLMIQFLPVLYQNKQKKRGEN